MAKNYISVTSHYAVSTGSLSVAIAAADANGFSDLMYIGGSSITALFIPGSNSGAAWTAANIVVYAALPGSQTNAANYAPVYKAAGTLYVIDVPTSVPAEGLIIQVDPYDFVGFDCVQFQSVSTGSSSTPVVQTNSPSITAFVIGNGTF